MLDKIQIASILFHAKRKGYLKPSDQVDECLVDIVNTANHLLMVLKQSGIFLDTLQVAHRATLQYRNCLTYLNELCALGLINRQRLGNSALWSFRATSQHQIELSEKDLIEN